MKITLRKDKESNELEGGVAYTVFAVYLESPIEFMIYVDSFPAAPYDISSVDVEIVDNRLSRYWVFGNVVDATSASNRRPALLAFPEWVNDVAFFESIIESKGDSGGIWRSYKEKMEFEFASTDLVKAAIYLGKGWVQCADCSDTWVPEIVGEVVSCPTCSAIQLRPESRKI